MDQVWKEWESRGIVQDRRRLWEERGRGEEIQETVEKKGLLRITGNWEEFEGFKGKKEELRDVVRGQVMTAKESMRRQHEQGMYFLHKDVEKRDREDPRWMKEGKEAGKVLEVRWGRQSMNVAGMKVKK